MRKVVLSFIFLIAIVSCKKEMFLEKEEINERDNTTNGSVNSFNPVIFSKTLAKAVETPQFQDFIKSEALIQFDGDYDILFQKIKNEIIDGRTIYERLLELAPDKAAFKKEVDENPLLTIYVPELKIFSANNWLKSMQTPLVAIRNESELKAKKKMNAYDKTGKITELDYYKEPEIPVIVVKVNERLTATSGRQPNRTTAKNRESLAYFSNENSSFEFMDECFTKRKNNENRSARRLAELSVDERVNYAFNKGLQSHRDYIYYGIDPTSGIDRGVLKNQYAEFITEFSFNNESAYNFACDWSEGQLEIYFNVFFINRAGGIETLRKGFSCSAFELEPASSGMKNYILPYPIEIACWDMQKYGDTWKFSVYEYDPGSEVTTTSTASSTFADNYEASGGIDFGIFKIGVKFNGTNTVTKTNTITTRTTNNSDDLAEALLDFGVPEVLKFYQVPIKRIVGGVYWSDAVDFYRLNTGFVSFVVETRKRV